MRSNWKLILKVFVSISLLALVASHIESDLILRQIAHIDLLLLFAGLGVICLQTLLAAIRWRLILVGLGIRVGYRFAFKAYLVAMFFNQMLPASLGGDLFRFWKICQNGHQKTLAFVAIFCERIYAIVALGILMIPSLILIEKLNREDIFYSGLILAATVIAVASVALTMDYLPNSWLRMKLVQSVASSSRIARQQVVNISKSLLPFSVSILIQILTIIYVIFMIHSLENSADLVVAAAMVPFIFLAAIIPISLAGWGVREGAMVFGLSVAGVSSATALVVSVILGIHLLILGIIGGGIWVSGRRRIEAT